MTIYEPLLGEHIEKTAANMAALAVDNNETVTATFNDIALRAIPGVSPQEIVDSFTSESNARSEAYRRSPEYKKYCEERDEQKRRQAAALASALLTAPTKATLRNQAAWDALVANNTDSYGAGIMHFAERWARVMESRMNCGSSIDDCAEEAAHVADTEGMSGFSYGCAVRILAECWQHGEALRVWHNLRTQIRDEGVAANAAGGVLNPALLRIS